MSLASKPWAFGRLLVRLPHQWSPAPPIFSSLEVTRTTGEFQKFLQVLGCHSWRFGANEEPCSLLSLGCLTGARMLVSGSDKRRRDAGASGASQTPERVAHPNFRCSSILETAQSAAYSSPRRKKSPQQPGDILFNAQSVRGLW